MAGYKILSSDDHVLEPAELWTERIEARYRDRAPRVLREENGDDAWFCDGFKILGLGPAAQVGRRFDEPEKLSFGDRIENMRPGGYIPEEHIKDMDLDGVDVSIMYPTTSLLIYIVPDTGLVNACFRAYNDWIAEFCRSYPARLKGIAMINLDNVNDGVRELQRCAKQGLVGAMITVFPPEDVPYDMPEYNPFWAAVQDLAMPISLHIGTNRGGEGDTSPSFQHVRPSAYANVDHWVRMSLGHMIFGGVFERYPRLQVGSVEMELSWAPHFLDRIDYTYTQRPPGDFFHRFEEDMLPSDYFHRNVFLGFQEDSLGIRDRDIIGVDKILWGSDYPHSESTFPYSRQVLEEILSDCTEEEKAKIAGANASRIYGLGE